MNPLERLWVDDERTPPSKAWWWAKTSADAIGFLERNQVHLWPLEISLDHDLGGADTTRPVVRWMAEHDSWPDVVRVHTANPVGRDYLTGMVERYGPGVTR